MDPLASRLFVCYVPGLDRRRLGAGQTPFLDELLARCPSVEIHGQPGGDRLPTLITGVYPHHHRLWQASLRAEARMSRRPRLGDRLPDMVSTTFQSLRHLVNRSRDLPAVPPGRRRQLQMHRVRHPGRGPGPRALERMGDFLSVFGILAADSRYLFTRCLEALERLGRHLPSARVALEFLDVYALDLFQHWHLDRPLEVEQAYRVVDGFVGALHERCRARGVTLLVLSDHGQQPVVGDLPLGRLLRGSPVPAGDYSYYVQSTFARFWFHTEDARARISHLLREVPHAWFLTLRDLRGLHIAFEDDAYGEAFLAAEPGWIFFPNDHHHPVLNLYRGLTDGHERPRLMNPRPRGAHGYLPEHACEAGFAVVADEGLRALHRQVELADVAPTLLGLLGEPRPTYMQGRLVFGRDQEQAGAGRSTATGTA